MTQSPPSRFRLPAVLANRTKLQKAVVAASAIVLLMIILLYTFRTPLLTAAARILIVDETPEPADVIVVPNGGEDQRAIRAAELFHQGIAPRIVIAQTQQSSAEELGIVLSGTEVAVELMEALGVPADSITVIDFGSGVTSTRDEAVAVRQYVDEHELKRVMIVTSAFHTRRARGIFAKELSNTSATLQVVAAPHRGFNETNWWQTEDGLVALNNEYIKSLFYILRY